MKNKILALTMILWILLPVILNATPTKAQTAEDQQITTDADLPTEDQINQLIEDVKALGVAQAVDEDAAERGADQTLSPEALDKTSESPGTILGTNTILKYAVQNLFIAPPVRGGRGVYTAATDAGSSVGVQNLLFGGAANSPGTSFTTIRVYLTPTTGRDYITTNIPLAAEPGFPRFRLDLLPNIQISGPRFVATAWFSAVVQMVFIEVVAVIPAPATAIDGNSRVLGIVLIANVGNAHRHVSVRYLWDTEVDGDDGPAVGSDVTSLVTHEATWAPPIGFIFGRNAPGAAPVFTAEYGSAFIWPIPNFLENSPSQILNARWPAAFSTVFSYTANPNLSTDNDNALLFYFGVDGQGSNPNNNITIPPRWITSCECEISIIEQHPVAGVVVEIPKLSVIGGFALWVTLAALVSLVAVAGLNRKRRQ